MVERKHQEIESPEKKKTSKKTKQTTKTPSFSTSVRQDTRKGKSPNSSQLMLPSVSWK